MDSWISGFLGFCFSGRLALLFLLCMHSLARFFLALILLKMILQKLWNKYYCNCCCFSGIIMIFQSQIFATAPCKSTLLKISDCNLALIFTAHTASICVFVLLLCSKQNQARITVKSEYRKLVRTKQIWSFFTKTSLFSNPLCIVPKFFGEIYKCH